MLISQCLLADIVLLPKNQLRLLQNIIVSSTTHTNVGYATFEELTPSQAQRCRQDLRALVKSGYLKKYPMTKASPDMRALNIKRSNLLSFYMLNPTHVRSPSTTIQGLENIWQLLR